MGKANPFPGRVAACPGPGGQRHTSPALSLGLASPTTAEQGMFGQGRLGYLNLGGATYRSADQVRDEKSPVLSQSYETIFERTLKEVASAATDLDVPLVPFWPIRGAVYDGSLLVIGRSVNGW